MSEKVLSFSFKIKCLKFSLWLMQDNDILKMCSATEDFTKRVNDLNDFNDPKN